jgi:hypothetical protein
MNLLEGIDIELIMYIFLLAVGGIFTAMQLKLMMFPDKRGRIVEFEDLSENSCNECKSRNSGRMSYSIKVETDDGELVDAEVSPCTLCMDKLRLGSKVGITKIGSRTIAQACMNLKSQKPSGPPTLENQLDVKVE